MPINAPDIPDFTGSVTTQQFMLLDSVSGDLSLFPVANFRGAGFYTGDVVPSEVHPDAVNGATYMDGDFYIYTLGNSNFLYKWDSIQLAGRRWQERGSLTGTRRHTAESLGANIFELANTLMNDPISFSAGDTYYNVVRNKTFGPHVAGTGIDFNVESRQYISGRNAQQLRHVNADPNKLPHTWTPALITDNTDPAYSPQRGDTYLQTTTLVDGEDSHGGFIHTWDEDTFLASIASGDSYTIAFGLGWNTIPKVFARDPKIFSESNIPTNNDLKHIDGDIFFDTDSLQMWRGYITGLTRNDPTPESDFEFLVRTWGGQAPQVLSANKIVEIQGDMVLPDLSVTEGDFIINNRFNTPTLHGPYDPADTANLPQICVMRGVHTFVENTAPDNTQATLRALGWMAVEGDTYVHDYGTGKSERYLATNVTETNVIWTLQGGSNSVQFHELTGRTRDDTTFSSGDYGLINGIMLGPYSENEISDTDAWPWYQVLRANITEVIPVTDMNNLPALTNTLGRLVENDTVIYRHNTTGKRQPWVVTGVNTNNYTPALARLPYESIGRSFEDPTTFQPVADDDRYQEGDFITNAINIRYGPYEEGAVDDQTAWPFLLDLNMAAVTISDDNNTENYQLKTNNGFPYIEEL